MRNARLVLILASLGFATMSSPSFSSDIEDLLKKAEDALEGPSSRRPKAPTTPKTEAPKPNTNPGKKSTTSGLPPAPTGPTKAETEEEKAEKEEARKRLAAVLRADKDAQLRERSEPLPAVTLGPRLAVARPYAYSLDKDDDTFQMDDASPMYGARMELIPYNWSLGSRWQLDFGGVLTLLRGDRNVERTGVEESLVTYEHNLAIMALQGEALYQFLPGWTIGFGGGYAGQLIRQVGYGENDTILQLSTSPVLSAHGYWRMSPRWTLTTGVARTNIAMTADFGVRLVL